MNKDAIIKCFEENPIILGMNCWEDFSLVTKNDSRVVFILFGTISNIADLVHRLKEEDKLVFVNIDMVDGFASKNSVVDFMKETEADGILSAKPHILRYAREQGMFTIHRFFVLDSSSWRNIGKQLEISRADIINITPGWTKVIAWTVEHFNVPVVASGLVCDKETVIDNLKAGAISICSTNHDIWEI